VGTLEGNGQLERPRPRWENMIKMDLREVKWEVGGMDWIGLVHDRDRWRALREKGNKPSASIKCGKFLD
jgi:hypothetical protein